MTPERWQSEEANKSQTEVAHASQTESAIDRSRLAPSQPHVMSRCRTEAPNSTSSEMSHSPSKSAVGDDLLTAPMCKSSDMSDSESKSAAGNDLLAAPMGKSSDMSDSESKSTAANNLLTAPIGKSLLRLALPTMVVLIAQTLAGTIETYYVGFLGTSALVGITLVFPIVMLMTMMSAGGIGGGVASAVSRSIGAGRRDEATAVVTHALVIAIVLGAFFSVVTILCGPALYRALGGTGDSLRAATTYSACVFAGAIPIWIVNLLCSALRGAGNVKVPALVTLMGAVVLVPLSPLLIFGFGAIKGLGIVGAGLSMTLYYCIASLFLIVYMARYSDLRLQPTALQARFFWKILSVGLISAMSAVQVNLMNVLLTGTVGMFGGAAIAGYGMASRLDYVLIPLLFGLASSVLTLVGTAVGAGDVLRAKRTTWMAVLVAFLFTEAVGLLVAVAPHLWLGLFSHDGDVLAVGSGYLRTLGPIYGAFGATFILSFSAIGGGRPIWPFLAGSIRFAISAGLGWLVVTKFHSDLDVLFKFIAAGTVAACLFCVGAAVMNLIWKFHDERNGAVEPLTSNLVSNHFAD